MELKDTVKKVLASQDVETLTALRNYIDLTLYRKTVGKEKPKKLSEEAEKVMEEAKESEETKERFRKMLDELPDRAQRMWLKVFYAAKEYAEGEPDLKDKADEYAARSAWSQVKEQYKKEDEEWEKKGSITKTNQGEKGKLPEEALEALWEASGKSKAKCIEKVKDEEWLEVRKGESREEAAARFCRWLEGHIEGEHAPTR